MKDFSRTILKTSAAIVVMAAIGMYAYYGEFKKGAEETRRKEEAKKLFNFDKSAVISLDVTKEGKTVSLVKAAGWTITSPVKADGDGTAVEQLIAALANFKVERATDEKPADLANYGLDAPALKVAVKLAGGTSTGLSIGAINQFDQTFYLMRDGDPKVYQASSSTRWSIDKDLFALRDKRIFTGDPSAEITRLEVRLPDKSYKAVRDGSEWSLEFEAKGKAQKDRADEIEMTKVVNAIRSVRAVGTAADGVKDPSAAGIDPLRGSISVWRGKDAVREEIFMALASKGDTPIVHAMRNGSDAVYELGQQFYSDINKGFNDLRNKKPLNFKRAEVKKIVLTSGETKAVLVKDFSDAGGDNWFMEGPGGLTAAKSVQVGMILSELEGMRAIEFKAGGAADIKESGLSGPHRTVGLYNGDGGELGKLEIGGTSENGVFVRSSTHPEVLLVEKNRVEQIPMDPFELKEEDQKQKP